MKKGARKTATPKQRLKFIAGKLSDGHNKGKLAFYCRVLHVSRQGFHDYLKRLNRPWKYERVAEEMRAILAEDKEKMTHMGGNGCTMLYGFETLKVINYE